MEKWTLTEVEEYLRHFGELVEVFDTNTFTDPIEVLYLLAKYCKNLLVLRCVGSLDIDYKKLKVVCSNLTEFEYYSGIFEGRRVFGKKSPLQKLALINCDAELPKWQLPHLKDATLHLIYQVGISKFFKRNPQLLRLDVSCMNYNYTAIKNLVHLKDFSFRAGFDKILISTECIHEVLDGLLMANASLEALTLDHFDINLEIITRICEFKTIEHLTFECERSTGDLDCSHLIRIVNNLPLLKELICDSYLFNTAKAHRLLANFAHKLRSAFIKVALLNVESDHANMNAISIIIRATNVRVEMHAVLGMIEMDFFEPTHELFYLRHLSYREYMFNSDNGYENVFINAEMHLNEINCNATGCD